MIKKPILLIVCLFVSSVLFGGTENALGNEKKIAITDALNRVVTIKQPVRRFAYTGLCLTDALKIIGVWDKIAARELLAKNKVFYPNIDRIPPSNTTPGNAYSLNFEKLFELDIDCLVTVKLPHTGFEEMKKKIEPRLPVIALDLFDHDTTKRNFEILGTIFGKAEKASDYIEWYEGVIKRILDKTSKLTPARKKRYFLKWSRGSVEEFSTMSDDFTGMSTINRVVGGINVAANLKAFGGWVQSVDPEWVAEQDIDIFICEDSVQNGFGPEIDDTSILSSYKEAFMKLPFLKESKAVKNKAVYMMSHHFLCTPAFVVALAYLAKWFHPDLFKDFDPGLIHQEYLTRFMGVDFDLSRHGVFVYPEF